MTVETQFDGGVLHVWLDRPSAHNALDDPTLTALADVFTRAAGDPAVRVVVLGGRGASFSAGADRRRPPGQGGGSARERRWRGEVGYRACLAIARCRAVTVARLHGNVIGGGLSLAISCDLRVAGRGTTFSLPEVALGLPLTWGTVPRLINEVGQARARELTLLCRPFGAERAASLGVVNEVVADGELDDAVASLVAEVLAKPELAVDVTKSQFGAYDRRGADVSYAEADLFNLAVGQRPAVDLFGGAGRTPGG